MKIKKLSFLSLIGIAATSCGNTDYFLNDFNVGQGTGLVGEMVSYSYLWYGGGSAEAINDEKRNHTFEIEYSTIDDEVYACYVPTINISGYKQGLKNATDPYGCRFDEDDETVVDGKFLWLFQDTNNFPVEWIGTTLNELLFKKGDKTLIFACEKQEATIKRDLFTEETLNKDITIYTMLDLIGDYESDKFKEIDRNTLEPGTIEWITLPQDFYSKMICSPYFTYPRLTECRVEITNMNGENVISLPVAYKVDDEYISLLEDIGYAIRTGDVYGDLQEDFKEILLDTSEFKPYEVGNDRFGYYLASDVEEIIKKVNKLS